MRDTLCEISEKLGEDAQTEMIRNEFYSFVKEGGGGDTSRQLSKFLEHVLKEDSKLGKVLKAINQSIIATPFIRLKMKFPNHIAFKDVSGTWKIIVNILPNEEIHVIHQKSGVSASPPPQGGFEFTWELFMRFDWELKNLMEADLKTTGVTFDSGINEQAKKEVQNIIDTFIC